MDTFRLQETGGWNSLVMPRRYVEDAKIANEVMGGLVSQHGGKTHGPAFISIRQVKNLRLQANSFSTKTGEDYLQTDRGEGRVPEYRKGAHTLYDIQYHVVWVTKYRYQVLRGEVAERA